MTICPGTLGALLALTLVSFFGQTWSYQLLSRYSASERSSLCTQMVDHSSNPPSAGNPFSLQLSGTSYTPGDNNRILVTISSSTVTTARGFVLQVRSVSGAPMDGEWEPLNNQQLYRNCGNSVSTVIHQGSITQLLPLSFLLAVPSTNAGNLQFRFTLVQDFDTFWQNIVFAQTLDSAVQDPCALASCLNGGSCVEVAGVAMCQCPSGFFGDMCETTDSNPCDQITCQNGGFCMSIMNTATCQCMAGFTGTFCETADICSQIPCLNGGVCQFTGGFFQCICLAGFSGVDCSIQATTGIDEAISSGTTENPADSDEQSNTTSPVDDVVDLCLEFNPCADDADCYSLTERTVCVCKNGMTGDDCMDNSNADVNAANIVEVIFVHNWWIGAAVMLVTTLFVILLFCIVCSCRHDCTNQLGSEYETNGVESKETARNNTVLSNNVELDHPV